MINGNHMNEQKDHKSHFRYSDYLFTPRDLLRGILAMLKNMSDTDVLGEAVIFLILIFVKKYLDWGFWESLSLAFAFAIFYWNVRFQTLFKLTLAFLLISPLLMSLFTRFDLLPAEDWAKQSATWAYYLLLFGVIKQAWELRRDDKKVRNR